MTTRMTGTRGTSLAVRHDLFAALCRGAADRVCLAATPTFAVMALLAVVFGDGPDMLCSALPTASPLNGMVWMYLLMSIFHTVPWLKLVACRWASR